jgi:putative NADH-flavin reductase
MPPECEDVRIVVLGASGGVGRVVVEEALKRRHEVTALARSPKKLADLATRIRIVQGDALDARAIEQAVTGQDVAIYALGAGNVRRTTLFSDSTRVLLTAMTQQGVRRLICVTGVGAGETKGHGGFLYDRILYPLFTRGIYADKNKQESLIRESHTDWTIVRPAPFRKDKPPGPLRAVTDVRNITLRKISRLEVAQFLVDELEQNRYVRQSVFIGHE